MSHREPPALIVLSPLALSESSFVLISPRECPRVLGFLRRASRREIEVRSQNEVALIKSHRSAPLRRSARIYLRVPVHLSGTFPDGKPFSEDTHIVSISKYGAKLSSRLPLRVGMQVKVKPKKGHDSAMFRVAWLGASGSPRAGEVGIEYVRVSNLLGVAFPE